MGSGTRRSAKRRRPTWSLCKTTGKRRYGDEASADDALAAADAERTLATVLGTVTCRDEIRVYRCPACLGWHLTSKRLHVRGSRASGHDWSAPPAIDA